MNQIPDLIYDVGMHNGNDTAYYLHKGYRVIAIEANPALVERGERRFATEIAAGKLRILHVGIAAKRGEAEFYVSKELDLWSSFDRNIATRDGQDCEAVRVPCIPFSDLVREHGVPFYVKIDIEGGDRLCLSALTADLCPPYMSVEMAHEDGDEDIRILQALGYTRFRCIRQNDLMPIHPGNIDTQLRLRRMRAGRGVAALTVRVIRRLRKTFARPADDGWVFPPGSSGTFGENWSGPWLSVEEALDIWQQLHNADIELNAGGLGEWFDIHAARD